MELHDPVAFWHILALQSAILAALPVFLASAAHPVPANDLRLFLTGTQLISCMLSPHGVDAGSL